MTNRTKLSVVILTHNEEHNIGDCLESCKWADEIVILDSGSTDKTIEIAEHYQNVRVIPHEWPGYAQAWENAINAASHEWVLAVAADERITTPQKEEIQKTLENPQHDAYENPRKNLVIGQWSKYIFYPDLAVRLVRKSKFFIEKTPVHERINVHGSIGKLSEPVIHLSIPDLDDRFIKIIERSSLERDKVIEQGTHFSALKFLTMPFLKFLYFFIVKRSFLAGSLGIYFSLERMMYEFQKQAKVWESTIKKGHDTSDPK